MDLKKLIGKLTTIVAAGAMVMSIGGGVVWANNCKDDYVRMSFDEAAGEYLNYTEGRNKEDTSCGYIKGKSALMIHDKYPESVIGWSKAFWARGYYVATVGNITEDAVKEYIQQQKEESKREDTRR